MFSVQVAGQFGEAYWDSLDAICSLVQAHSPQRKSFYDYVVPIGHCRQFVDALVLKSFLKYKVPATSEGFVASFKKLQYNFPKMRGSKTVWNFSENSFVLVMFGIPKM